MSNSFRGKVAVVTGGGTGIGRAMSLGFAKEGAAVVVASLMADEANAVASEIRAMGGKALGIAIDVTDVSAVEAMAETVQSEFGRADFLVTSAGVMGAREFITQTSAEQWRRTIDVNLNAGFHCIKAFLPGMLERNSGRVIMISSTSGKLPAARNADYAASKHGVIGLTKALALELGMLKKDGVTANAICPGSVATQMIDDIADSMLEKLDETRESFTRKYVASKNIQRRLLDTEEVADMAMFLASDKAKGITGQAINVCAGTVLS
jgi:NAD(P)-dependent dehydrogenase (short-subunit alcohol dehydrogenase family)